MKAYAARIGDHLGGGPRCFLRRDPQRGAQLVWAEGFAERFRTMKGYDLVPLLPGLVCWTSARHSKLRCDYYDV
jgi:hypothetical protein